MTHMTPEITKTHMINVETDAGTFLVPTEVFNPEKPLECTEGTELYGAEKVSGWFARLSASGYLDSTDWMGPYGTEWEAKAALLETYDTLSDSDPGELTDRADYVGDVDYCHGGVWFDLSEDWEYGYVKALEVCPIPGHHGALWVSPYTTLTPEAETLEEALEDRYVREALDFCGMDAEELEDVPNWRLALASMLFDVGRKDPDCYTAPMVILTEDFDRDDGITVDDRIPEGKALDLFLSERIDWTPAAAE